MQSTELKAEFELKSDAGGDDVAVFSGVASNNELDDQGDIIEPGAFLPIPLRKSGPDVLLLRDHDRSQVIGGWSKIEQNGRKLLVEGELCLQVEKARETYALLKRGFLSGLSVGFMPSPDGVKWDRDRRRITKASLREISIVAMPANRGARVTLVKQSVVRWLARNGCTSREIENAINHALEDLIAKKSKRRKQDYDVPEPDEDESRSEFMTRCRAEVIDEQGADRDEANRLCFNAWEDSRDEEASAKPPVGKKRARKQDAPDPDEGESRADFMERCQEEGSSASDCALAWENRNAGEASGKAEEGDYGDVDYADPGYQEDKKPRYPINNEQRIRAAWNYIHHEDNQALYTREQVRRIMARIVRAWKDKIDPDGPPGAEEDSAPPSPPRRRGKKQASAPAPKPKEPETTKGAPVPGLGEALRGLINALKEDKGYV